MPGKTRTRQEFIDVARGFAMLFVLISHFSFTYFPNQLSVTPTVLRTIGMVASPTFMIINGLLIGFLCQTRRSDFKHLHVAFTDRGLLLLSIGHLLILGSHLPWYTTRFLSITDTVAVCMLVGPSLAIRLRPAVRLAIGLTVYAVSWIAVERWHPNGILFEAVQETLFGSVTPTVYVYAFPIVPWLGLDLAASALGSRLGELYSRQDTKAMERMLVRLGAAGFIAAIGVNAIYHLANYAAHDALTLRLHWLGSPFQKEPPGFDYVLFFGSCGVCLVAASIRLLKQNAVPWLTRRMAQLGQTSFVVFVFQFYVYLTIVVPIRRYLPYRSAWPVYFLASVVVIVLPSLLWHRRGYNRFLTIGYRYLQGRPWNVSFGSWWAPTALTPRPERAATMD
jgi:uncharacterized membrane protein